MKKYIYHFALLATSLSICIGCGDKNSHGEHGHDEHEEAEAHKEHNEETHKHGDGEILFSPQQAKAAGLQTEKIKALPFERTIKVSGKILTASGDQHTVSAPASGIISVVGRPLTVGMAVNAGQTLFSISSKGLEQSDASVAIKIRYDAAKREYERAKALIADRIISQVEFTAIEEAYRTAAADMSTIANRAVSGNVAATSPISGYLIEQLAQPGQFVAQGTPLALISQNKRLQLRAEVPQQYASQVAEIVSANFVMPYADGKSYSLSGMNGKKISSGKSADASAGYIPVIFEFDNKAGIVPGTFVETYLMSGNYSDAITVPVSALTEDQGLYFVYIRIDDHAYRKQEVKTGSSNGQRIEILEGVKPGDEVVITAVTYLKLAANAGQIPAGHSHQH